MENKAGQVQETKGKSLSSNGNATQVGLELMQNSNQCLSAVLTELYYILLRMWLFLPQECLNDVKLQFLKHCNQLFYYLLTN